MKRSKLIAVVAGGIVLTGLGSAGFAVAQTFSHVQQSLLSSSNKMESKMNELSPADDAQQRQETDQAFASAGINLTPAQVDAIYQADRRLMSDLRQVFQAEPLLMTEQLIAVLSLPQPQGEALANMTGLDRKLEIPLLAYDERVLDALTLEQRILWEEHRQQRQSEPVQVGDEQFKEFDTAPDPAEEARQWEETKQRFRAAGVPLTPQQEAQMQSANAKMRIDYKQEVQSNPGGTGARFVAMMFLPSSFCEQFSNILLPRSFATHQRTVKQILTSAQQKVWQQGTDGNQS